MESNKYPNAQWQFLTPLCGQQIFFKDMVGRIGAGELIGFDKYCIVVKRVAVEELIFKHAISAIWKKEKD